LAVVSGLLMVFIGLRFFGFFQRFSRSRLDSGGNLLVSALRALLKAPGAAAPLAFGVLNGFLPCRWSMPLPRKLQVAAAHCPDW